MRIMLEHTKFMLKNFYVTDTFTYGSYVCLAIAMVAELVLFGLEKDGIQSEDEKLVKRCKFLVIISLIGYCILAILNFTILPYSVPIYDWDELALHRFMALLILVIILLVLVDIRNVIKKNWQ